MEAEHTYTYTDVLDASYETYTRVLKQYSVACDCCRESGPRASSLSMAQRLAHEEGWQVTAIDGGGDLCPECRAAKPGAEGTL
jgi:hypothetical protein